MATEKKDDTTGAPSAAKTTGKQPDSFAVTVDEFCSRLSAADGRVEMIGAYHASEKAAGRSKDTESNYRQRFDAFCRRPIKD